MKRARIAVIGGANMDIAGSPNRDFRLHDSNPGQIRLRPGGVGRNIAHDLCLLGQEVSLVTALGEDLFALGIRQTCEQIGIDLSMSATVPGAQSSSYLYVTEPSGDMHIGVADMEITDALTPELLRPILPKLNSFDALVVDANLPEESLCFLAENAEPPLCADPVSAAKAPRLLKALPHLSLLKPNLLEAAALTGVSDAEAAVEKLLSLGVERVFLSRGVYGLCAAKGAERLSLPCRRLERVNATGAGDAATAALVWAMLQGLNLSKAAEAALEAGAQTAASSETNPAQLDLSRFLPGAS